MSNQKMFMIKLETKEGERFNFFGTIHKSETQDELLLDRDLFYKRFGGKIPEGVHYEIQWGALPVICKDVKKDLLHIHEEDKQNFICWTKQVATEEECLEVVKVAALGMLYGSKTGQDFADVFVECKESMGETIQKLSELCNLNYEPLLFFNEATVEGIIRHNTIAGTIFFL